MAGYGRYFERKPRGMTNQAAEEASEERKGRERAPIVLPSCFSSLMECCHSRDGVTRWVDGAWEGDGGARASGG